MNKMIMSTLIAVIAMFSYSAIAGDVSGTKDYPLIKRYEGSEIVGYKSSPFDEYTLSLSDQPGFLDKDNKNNKVQVIEGAVTRIVYRVPVGHTTLEIFRNYQQALAEANFQILFASSTSFNYVSHFWGDMCRQGTDDNCADVADNSRNGRYMAAKLADSNGKDIYVGVLVSEKEDNSNWTKPWRNPNMPVKEHDQFAKGEVIVLVDVIETKAMENKMVLVKSYEMADAINKTGKIDIYGITFDIDKTDIKPESVPTIAEVAKLLTENPSLKLEISGHTDNTGSAPHNRTLSEGRAASVVNTLVSQYHVDASRLIAKGYGDAKPIADNATEEGRAKNRRVELSKLP